ncbi:glycerol-3-phosphate dehydrogenase [Sphingomonas sp. SM33]|uniref:Glycerol-3-phosphate dehydrogenase n=1 Tax=Sphingomonas telluris TaxID=2907998 RepID=A0ABS9VPN3_9SPHN|nr:glycerol-3-phosphate dehydrogenase [Sphingomonas telluris]
MTEANVDLLIVGGGINGAGIAREAAWRGLSVVLVEKDDLGAHTSSASSKLVHGGLRYLEQCEFRLVRESLTERERLLRSAPHIVEPLQFVLPLDKSSRPAWIIRAGLFLYDRLSRRDFLPGSRSVRLEGPLGAGLRPGAGRGFTYWDCRVQDSRLVVLTAMSAAERGARILTRTELVEARRESDYWVASYRGSSSGRTIRARAVVNAAGPWVGDLFDRITGFRQRPRVRLVKGSHIVVPRLFPGDHAFILQGDDGRVVFAIPFERVFTLVGTTDVDWSGDASTPAITEGEIDYLLAIVGRTFTSTVSRSDIVWTYSGVRSLIDDGKSASKVTRDYALELDDNGPPLLSVIGGKLTTYRRLAERALDRLAPFFPGESAQSHDDFLPGGDLPDGDVAAYSEALASRFPELPAAMVDRLARTYGTRAEAILKGARTLADLGEDFGAGLTSREIEYLVAHEWAGTAEDVVFRRTKLGLRLSKQDVSRVAAYLAAR